jgi:hypothetical protein
MPGRGRRSTAKPPTPAALARALRGIIRRTLNLRLDLEALRAEHDRLAAALGADRAHAIFQDECMRFQRTTGQCSICGVPVDDHEAIP